MLPRPQVQDRALFAVAMGAAAFIQISIAVSQILLGAGILLLIVFRRRLAFPRIWLPLACLAAWTVLADILSPDPWLGRAQLKKFFVFLFIPLVYEVFSQQFRRVFYLICAWAAAASASALWAILQFIRHAHETYIAYVGRRITGFESHWMTFGALQLSVLLLLLAQLFFSNRRMPLWAYLSVVIIPCAILLGGTRSIWIAAVPAVLYLLWFWRPKTILALPVLALLAFFASPHNIRERITSLAKPREDVDSNRHRYVTFRTGVEMIRAHPWFGLGPEEINGNFRAYVPRDIRRPLPPGYYGHLHNVYLQYAAERGIPALLLLLWFIGLAVYDCFRGLARLPRKISSEPRFLLHGVVAVTLAILVGGIFEYNLGDSEVLMMFLAVISLGYAALDNLPGSGDFVPSAQTVSKYGGSVSR